jgi:hypothetical protein
MSRGKERLSGAQMLLMGIALSQFEQVVTEQRVSLLAVEIVVEKQGQVTPSPALECRNLAQVRAGVESMAKAKSPEMATQTYKGEAVWAEPQPYTHEVSVEKLEAQKKLMEEIAHLTEGADEAVKKLDEDVTQAAERKALEAVHEAQVKDLHEARDSALKERAETDKALAENLGSMYLDTKGQEMIKEAQESNQQQIKDQYADKEADLRQQQGVEMAALQTKQFAAQNHDVPPPPPPPPPAPPTRSF